MEIAIIGLLAITAGWLVQYAHSRHGKKDFLRKFLALYALGCEILAVDAVTNNAILPGLLNLACAIMAALILNGMPEAGQKKS